MTLSVCGQGYHGEKEVCVGGYKGIVSPNISEGNSRLGVKKKKKKKR
jgi:hypothetical protein